MPRTSRPYGQGSIYQSRKKWVVAVPVGQGQRITERYATKEAAERAQKRLVRERDAGQHKPVATVWTVGDFLEEWYGLKLPELRAYNTRVSYRYAMDRLILPGLGKVRLVDLTPLAVQRWLAGLRPQRPGRAPLSRGTLSLARTILSAALASAVDLELIPRNVAARVRLPAPPAVQRTPFTTAEARQILQAADGDRLGAAWWCAALLGLRRGELAGLTWSAIDFEVGTVEVRQQIQREAGQRVPKPPKRRASERLLPLPDVLADRLRRRRTEQMAERLAAGPAWQETDCVFATLAGQPLDGKVLAARLELLCRRLGLPPRGPHALRHSVSSELAALGVPDRVRADILGHTSVELTNRSYTQTSLEQRRAALELLSRHLTG